MGSDRLRSPLSEPRILGRMALMSAALIFLDPGSPLSLQNQIREKLVELIVSGAVPPGTRLPSIRGLAEQLQVSRNTVVLAYQQLLAEGFLITRQRSGIYPNPAMVSDKLSAARSEERRVGKECSS